MTECARVALARASRLSAFGEQRCGRDKPTSCNRRTARSDPTTELELSPGRAAGAPVVRGRADRTPLTFAASIEARR
jgi:hypothetical protein